MAESLTSRVAYTISRDIHSQLFYSGLNIAQVTKFSEELYETVVGSKVKFRKPVTSRAKLSLAQKGVSITEVPVKTENIKWVIPRENPNMTYTKSIRLTGGYYPICEISSGKCLYAINSDGYRQLTKSDKRILSEYGISF